MAGDGQAARAARTRTALLRAAGELLEHQGLEAITLRSLGAAAGVSRGAPYRHFAGKDELLAAVAAQGLDDLRGAMLQAGEPVAAGGDPLASLEAMMAAYIDTALASPAHYRLIFSIDLANRDHPELTGAATAAYQLLLQTVTDGQAAGALPAAASPLRLAALLLATTHGLVDLLASGHGYPDRGLEDPRTLIRLLLNSLAGQPDHP
jgi:AcrR family transcriptional regulator